MPLDRGKAGSLGAQVLNVKSLMTLPAKHLKVIE
jgi:hypothetical protein